jgi:hypothetical protein
MSIKVLGWSQNMRSVIEREKEFSEVFQLTSENKLDFTSQLSNGEREEIQEYVDSRFKPPLFTTRVHQ